MVFVQWLPSHLCSQLFPWHSRPQWLPTHLCLQPPALHKTFLQWLPVQICSQFFPWHSHSLARHRCTQVSALQLMVHFVRAQHVILQLLPEKKLKRLHVICKLLQWSQFWELLTCNSFGLTNKKTPVGFFCITLSVFRYTNKDSFYDIFFSEFQWQIQRDWDGNTATPPHPPPPPPPSDLTLSWDSK